MPIRSRRFPRLLYLDLPPANKLRRLKTAPYLYSPESGVPGAMNCCTPHATLSNGNARMQHLSELPLAAMVVEGRYSSLFKPDHVSGALARGPAIRP